MSEAKKNPFVSEDSTVQKVMEYADARLCAGEYSVAAALYGSMHNIDGSNFYAKFKYAVATAQCDGKEYDLDLLMSWSDALFEARDLYYEYAGETKEFIDVIGSEIERFEKVALERADKAKNARITLARKFEEDVRILCESGKNASEISGEVQKLSADAASHEGMLVSFSAMLVSAWAAQILGLLKAIRVSTNFQIEFYEELKKKVAAHRGKWHVDTRALLHESIKHSFDVPVGESEALFAVIDKSIDKISEMLDGNINTCKEALYAKYWSEHPEERKALEDKKSILEQQLAAETKAHEEELDKLEKEISTKESYIEAANEKCASENEAATEQIEKLKEEKKEVGFFNFKAKKEIRQKIKEIRETDENNLENTQTVVESLTSEKEKLEEMLEKLNGCYEVKKTSLELKLKEVDEELTKERV